MSLSDEIKCEVCGRPVFFCGPRHPSCGAFVRRQTQRIAELEQKLNIAVDLLKEWLAGSQWMDGACTECLTHTHEYSKFCDTHQRSNKTRDALAHIGASDEGGGSSGGL